jgi:hypothetical protein
MYKWIAHVVRAWDLGSRPLASLIKCLKVLSHLSKMGTVSLVPKLDDEGTLRY